MSCTLKQEEALNELLDGNLDAAGEAEVLAHLEACAACRATEEALRDLARQTAQLPGAMTPPRDMWPALRRRITADERLAPRPVPRWGFALAAGLMAAGVLIGLQIGRGTGPAHDLGAAPNPAGVITAAADPLAGLRAAEADFQRATATLMAELEARRAALPPSTLASVDENLETIRTSIHEVWSALESEPDNLHNAYLLVGLYRTQMDLLQRTVKVRNRDEAAEAAAL